VPFPTKDGSKKFGSRFAQRKYDQHHGAAEKPAEKPAASAGAKLMNDAHESQETPEFESGEQEGAQEGQQQQEAPEQVVKQHGKAQHVHVSHDNTNNKHHVHSVHADGHVHDSDHASAQEAQTAAKQLGGGDQTASELPQDEGAPEPDGFKMPRLA
jgi:hypothetical protein